MGHNTILTRIFIKVDEERFVPYVNTRSSNTTVFSNKGREVYAKEDYPLNIKRKNVTSLQEVQQWIDETVARQIENNKGYDWADKTDKAIRDNFIYNAYFHLSGKTTMSDKQLYNWFKSGFKNGYTIEEIKSFYPLLTVYLRDYDTKDTVTADSTEELIAILDNEKYKNYQLYINNYDDVLKAIQSKNKLNKFVNTKNVPVSEFYYVADESTSFHRYKRKVRRVFDVEHATKFKHKSQAELFAKRLRERFGIADCEVKKEKLNKPQLINF